MPFFEEKIDQNDAAEGIRTAWQKNRLMEDMGEDLDGRGAPMPSAGNGLDPES